MKQPFKINYQPPTVAIVILSQRDVLTDSNTNENWGPLTPFNLSWGNES